jgi:lipopolysaccharide transport system ATP-binding protein
MSVVIKVENLSKQYRLGSVGTGSLAHDLNRGWHRLRGKEDPYLKIGDTNDRSTKATSEYVWALKDINFEVKQGEVLGIIGRNGAGKSTLLKILSRTTTPTTGSVKIKGRVASLLEVGTGFHPELSGRENIFLNGAILGMTKQEIKSKFDEIVDFAGVERYIDTPVKRYSSGMYVRLAFGVAAHLEPEILIVDEVLAVGDAEFQKKALGKMKDVSDKDGRTVIFVSHNMAAIKTLCNTAIVLEQGCVKYEGLTPEAVSYYLRGDSKTQNKKTFGNRYDTNYLTLHEISISPVGGTSNSLLDEFDGVEMTTTLTIKKKAEALYLTFVLNDENGETLFTFSHASSNLKLADGFNSVKCTLPKGFLNIGTYYVSIYLIEDSRNAAFIEKDIISFSIQEGSRNIGGYMEREPGFIKPLFQWEVNH